MRDKVCIVGDDVITTGRHAASRARVLCASRAPARSGSTRRTAAQREAPRAARRLPTTSPASSSTDTVPIDPLKQPDNLTVLTGVGPARRDDHERTSPTTPSRRSSAARTSCFWHSASESASAVPVRRLERAASRRVVAASQPGLPSLQSAAVSGDRLKLEVREREEIGSRHTRRLRSQGLIPGVLYGKGHARPIVVPERAAPRRDDRAIGAARDPRRRDRGRRRPCIPRSSPSTSRDPIRGTISHIDLREVRLDQPIHATVVVHLIGEPAGVKLGGMLSLVAREIQVEALPADVPSTSTSTYPHMDIGDVLRLRQTSARSRT